MNNLDKNHLAFARLIATDEANATRAMLAISPHLNYESAKALASRWAARPDVKAEVARIRADGHKAAVLTLAEKRAFLRSVVLTPIGKVNECSELAEELTEMVSDNGNTRKVKMPSKLKALQLDAMLAGEFAPVKTEASVVVGIGSLLSALMFGKPQPAIVDSMESDGDLI